LRSTRTPENASAPRRCASNEGGFCLLKKILLCFEDVTLPDGSVGSGTLLHIDDFFGALTVSFDGTDWRCTAEDQAAWRTEIMDVILRAAAQE